MKKLIASATTLAALVTLAPQSYALNVCAGGSFGNLCGKQSSDDIQTIIATAVNFIFVLAVIIALFYLIWGGIKWLLSQGDKSAVEGARSHIIAALIGLVIVFLSYFILNLVLSFFGLSIATIQFPHL